MARTDMVSDAPSDSVERLRVPVDLLLYVEHDVSVAFRRDQFLHIRAQDGVALDRAGDRVDPTP